MRTVNPLREECRRQRIEERLSAGEIGRRLGIPKCTVSLWLKDIPLTKDEMKEKISLSHLGKPTGRMKDRGEASKYHRMVSGRDLTRQDKGKIAESAVLFRLSLLGFIVYGSPFDGDKADWLVEYVNHPGKTYRIQVKWVKEVKNGLPLISLECVEHGKMKRYQKGDFDFIVGYWLYNDTAYVYSFDELQHLRSRVTISENGKEAWDKIKP